MIDYNVIDWEKFWENDSYTSVDFKIWRIWKQAVVTTKLWMNWDWDKAWDAFVNWMHHWMISTMLSIVEECWWDDMVVVDIIKSWLEELWEIAVELNKKHLHDDEDEDEDSKEDVVKAFKKCFKNK